MRLGMVAAITCFVTGTCLAQTGPEMSRAVCKRKSLKANISTLGSQEYTVSDLRARRWMIQHVQSLHIKALG
jgi:DNA-directed RNA polymerase subunit N (RpoN/RPB10)